MVWIFSPATGVQVVVWNPLPAVGDTAPQLAVRSGPITSGVQVVVMKLESVPGVHDAAGVGAVVA